MESDSNYQPILSARERTKIELLARLFHANVYERVRPTKYRLIGACPASTRSLRYQMITALIDHGLVENCGTPDRYALQITVAGMHESIYWARQQKQERDHQ